VKRRSRGRLFGCACAALAIAAAAGAAERKQAARPEPDSWYAESFSQGERGFLATHYWSKGSRFRSEIVIAGHRIVTIVNGETYYILDAVGKTGVAIQRSPLAIAADAKRGRPFGREFERLVAGGGEKVKTEKLGGRDCELYRLTNSSGRFEVCVTPEEPRLPIRVETFNRATGATDSVDYLNWLSGMPLPDAFFEPDPRIELERVDYDDYRKRSVRERIGPAPVLFSYLLHGEPK
jgi:hypothetical protein